MSCTGREKECYRDNLARLDEMFPGKEMLTVADVAKLYGIADTRALIKHVKFVGTRWSRRVSKASLARQMSSY